MQHAANKASISHEMSTTNVGEILSAERASRAWPPGNGGRHGRNSFQEPAEFMPGPGGMVGGGDACNSNDLDGDFDAGPWDA